MTHSKKTGVLLTAFGGPDSLDSVGPFMAKLMHREPAPEMVARAKVKYEAIGGRSPLTPIAEGIASALEGELRDSGFDSPVRVGMRYWDPYIPAALDDLIAEGCERIITISLSPFESKVAGGSYREAVADALDGTDIEVCETATLHTTQGFKDFLAIACKKAISADEGERTLTVMSAHSLPMTDLETDDPYVNGLRSVAEGIAASADLGTAQDISDDSRLKGIETFGSLDEGSSWVFAYQSKGMRGGEWLGPDIADVFSSAAEAGFDSVIVCPVGFATDHMETLYDLDIVAARDAAESDLAFARAEVPNDDPLLIEAFMGLIVPFM